MSRVPRTGCLLAGMEQGEAVSLWWETHLVWPVWGSGVSPRDAKEGEQHASRNLPLTICAGRREKPSLLPLGSAREAKEQVKTVHSAIWHTTNYRYASAYSPHMRRRTHVMVTERYSSQETTKSKEKEVAAP